MGTDCRFRCCLHFFIFHPSPQSCQCQETMTATVSTHPSCSVLISHLVSGCLTRLVLLSRFIDGKLGTEKRGLSHQVCSPRKVHLCPALECLELEQKTPLWIADGTKMVSVGVQEAQASVRR